MFGVRAARLFDGTSGSSLRQPLVLVEDGRIADVTESGAAGSGGVTVIDLGDVTLLPGLIDCHQHLVFDASDDPVDHLAGRDDGEVLEQARLAARSALAAGITTVRDLGDRSYVLLALREETAITSRPPACTALVCSQAPRTRSSTSALTRANARRKVDSSAGPRAAGRAQHGQHLRAGVGGPLPDRGERPRPRDHRRDPRGQ